jgi:hypothetical protein
VEALEERGFRKLRKAFPLAIVQCTIDYLVHDILNDPKEAKRALTGLQSWGISRFSFE